jgi:hypothetical protein
LIAAVCAEAERSLIWCSATDLGRHRPVLLARGEPA